MVRALILQTMRAPLASWPRVTLALFALLLPLAQQALAASSETPDLRLETLAAILLSGACRADVTSGLLRAILGRPVPRATWLLCRWAGGAILLWTCVATMLLASVGLALAVGVEGSPRIAGIALALAMLVPACAMLAAWFVAASAVLPAFLDVVLPLLFVIAVQFARELLPGEGLLLAMLEVPMAILVPSPEGGSAAMAVRLAGSTALLLGLGLLLVNRLRIPAEART